MLRKPGIFALSIAVNTGKLGHSTVKIFVNSSRWSILLTPPHQQPFCMLCSDFGFLTLKLLTLDKDSRNVASQNVVPA
ncbi:hypothetical protein ACTXT7_005235 [Hymenolepis weldensis]